MCIRLIQSSAKESPYSIGKSSYLFVCGKFFPTELLGRSMILDYPLSLQSTYISIQVVGLKPSSQVTLRLDKILLYLFGFGILFMELPVIMHISITFDWGILFIIGIFERLVTGHTYPCELYFQLCCQSFL